MRTAGFAAAVFAYTLAARALPDVPLGVDATIGTVLLFAVVLGAARIGDAMVAAMLLGAGAALMAGALHAGDAAPTAAAVPAAVACACVGALFARWLELPALVLVLPVVVAVIDAVAVGSGGAPVGTGGGGDLLSIDVPAWGGGTAVRIGVADPIFAAVFWTWSHRLGLRERATFGALLIAAGGAVALVVAAKVDVPVLALLAAAFYLPNLDLLGGLLRRDAGPPPAR